MGGVCVCLPQTRVFHFLAVSGTALLWKDSSVVVPGICKSHPSLFSCSITTGSTLNFTFYICSSFSVRPLYFLVFSSSSCCCCQLGLPHISLLLFSPPNQPPLCLVGWIDPLTLTDPWLPCIHCLLSLRELDFWRNPPCMIRSFRVFTSMASVFFCGQFTFSAGYLMVSRMYMLGLIP